MEEMPPPVAIAFSLTNPICNNSGISSRLDMGRLKKFLSDDYNGINSEGFLDSGISSKISLPVTLDIKGDQIVAKVISLDENCAAKKQYDEGSTTLKTSVPVLAVRLPPAGENKRSAKSVFELNCVPLWGSVSICGKRPEMEDVVVAVPKFTDIPIQMLIGDRSLIDGMNPNLTHLTSHFFGVYDGHGGAQVANYCSDRIHLALADELKITKGDFLQENMKDTRQSQWENAFTSCFSKIDDEVGGNFSREIIDDEEHMDIPSDVCEPVAPETAGSTAVVAVICSSHIIVANCGDSRAVLCRGKEAIALSIDHKPNREDEYLRIEACGGKIIQWNGHRVFGVLAMSRSIGDRYMKPWIIPEPEVMFVARAREDECLILASDGLWDVITNEEACEVAKKKILLWHKKNEVATLVERGREVDPAAQAAAEFLSTLALQKGSKDNISVIVVDLKANRRKFKSKTC